MRPTVLPLCALAALALSAAASAQITLSKVVFRNQGALQQGDLEAAAKVHAGEKTSFAQIQTAAQRLMDTGFFDDVKVDSSGPASALTLIFMLKELPAGQAARVGFENFVWLTPQELTAAVHTVVPLFADALPETNTALDGIDAALQAALAVKGVAKAQVSHTLLQPTSEDPVHAFEFRVDRPAVLINSVTLEGLAPAVASEMNRVAARLRGASYAAGYGPRTTADRVLAPYLNAGYLDARLLDVQTHFTNAANGAVMVDLSAKVEGGDPFQVKAIHFTETPLVSTSRFEAQAKLHPGDVASRSRLLETVAPIDSEYQQATWTNGWTREGCPTTRRTR